MISNAAFTSAIDPTVPVFGTPTTASVRDNFASAKSEIEGLAAQLAALGDLAQVNAPLPIAQGGTGQTDAAAALLALGGAPLASPALTGIPTAPTAAAATNTAQLATTAYVKAQNYLTAPVSLTTQVSGILPVAGGGTGLAAGTPGGVPYFSAAGTMAASAALASNALVTGGGAGGAPVSVANWIAMAGAGLLRGNFMTAGSPPGAGSSPAMQLLGPDTSGFPVFNLTAWGTGLGYLTFVNAGGTGAAPAATVSGQPMGRIVTRGYDGTAYLTSDSARIEFLAAETFSTTGRGARLTFATVAAGTTALSNRLRIEHDGGLLVPESVAGGSLGPGSINVSGGYYIGGARVASSAWTLTAANTFVGNFSATPAPGLTLVGLQIAGNTGNIPGVQLDAFANNSSLALRRANGTPAAPTAIANNDRLGQLAINGYTGSGYSGNVGLIDFVATQAWTATANGTGMEFRVTPNGAIGNTVQMGLGLGGLGGLALPGNVAGGDVGAGTVNVSGGYYLGGAAVSDPNWTFNAAHNEIGNFSGSAAPAIVGGIVGSQIVGAAGQAPGMQTNAFGALSLIGLSRADGTPAAPAAIAAAERLSAIYAYGYDGTAYQNVAAITFEARQAFTASARGAGINLWGTPTGSTAITALMSLGATGGGATLPNTVTGGDMGLGTVNVSAGYYLGGAAALTLSGSTRQLSATTMTGVLTLAADPTVALGAATKQYVDNVAGAAGGPFLPIAGGTLTGALNVNLGGALAPAQVLGMLVQGPDNPATVPGIQITRFGGTAGLQWRTLAAGGTAAAPTAITSGTIIGDWFTLGYSGTAFRTGTILRNTAAENWSATAGGANFQIITTQIGSTTQNSSTFHGNGSLLIPTTVAGGNTGAGTINVSAGYYLGGVNIRTGTVAADQAPAGQIGEVISVSATQPANLTSNVPQAIGSFALTAGDWDVLVGVAFVPSAAQVTGAAIQLSGTSGSMAGAPSGGFGINTGAGNYLGNITGWAAQRQNNSTATTVYVNVNAVFASGTMQAWVYGWARRAR